MNCQVTADGWMGVSVCSVRGFRSAWITVIKLTYVLPGLYPLLVIPQLFFFFLSQRPTCRLFSCLSPFVCDFLSISFWTGRISFTHGALCCRGQVPWEGLPSPVHRLHNISIILSLSMWCCAPNSRRLCWPNSISSKETLVREGHVLPPRRRALL